jgi:hypothetical protein
MVDISYLSITFYIYERYIKIFIFIDMQLQDTITQRDRITRHKPHQTPS